MSDSIDYYSNSSFNLIKMYHYMGPVSFFLNFFGLYMVLFKTSKTMGEYRIHLLFHLSISAIFEFYMCVLCCPKLYTPRYMGSTHGLLTSIFGLRTFYQQWICFVLVSVLLVSCGHLSYYRANSILINGTSFKLSHNHFIILILLLYIQVIASVTFLQFRITIEQDPVENARQFLINFPQFVSLHDPQTAATLYLVDKGKAWGSSFLKAVSVFMITILIWNFTSCSMMIFQITSKMISQQNAQMIKKYLIGVQLQISPCVICYLIPCCWLASCLVLDIEIPIVQILNDASCFCTVIQSPMSITVLLYTNSDYRAYIKSLLKILKPTRNVNGRVSTSAIRVTSAVAWQ